MSLDFAAFCLTAPRSGEGKTTLSLALMHALTLRGLHVQGFKCGPDYIDPTFHAQATGRVAYNLDTWMMGQAGVQALWARHVQHADVAVCEGVMGLFDGREPLNARARQRTIAEAQPNTLLGSTIDCAHVLGMPILLTLNARGMAGSIHALVEGFVRGVDRYTGQRNATASQQLEATGGLYSLQPTRIVGVLANNCGSPRHADILRRALERAGLPPLLGALPREQAWHLPERQLGLLPAAEYAASRANNRASLNAASQSHGVDTPKGHPHGAQETPITHTAQDSADWLLALARAAEQHLDVDAILARTRIKRPPEPVALAEVITSPKRRLGIAKDAAFCFYYEENERVLRAQGWELIPFSPIEDTALPEAIQALYLGGGYPEVFVKQLSENRTMRESIRAFAKQGGAVYAECGGYMYLCRELVLLEQGQEQRWPLCGVIEGTATMGDSLRSLGYREASLVGGLPLHLTMPSSPETASHAATPQDGNTNDAPSLRGHEFHWSTIVLHQDYPPLYRVHGRHGVTEQGVAFDNIRAGYLHLYWGHLYPIQTNEREAGTPSSYEKTTTQPSLEQTSDVLHAIHKANAAVSATHTDLTPSSVAAHRNGSVLLLNGASSAGKTTLARGLQQALHQRGIPSMVLSADLFLHACSGSAHSILEGIRQTRLPIIEAFHASIEAAARAGAQVIVDHVIGEDAAWVDDLQHRLTGIPIQSVQVVCDVMVLQAREQQRQDRPSDWEHASRQHASIYLPLPDALQVDTTHCTPQECVAQTLRHWHAASGTLAGTVETPQPSTASDVATASD